MIKLQRCKKRNKTGNKNGLNLYSALGLGAGKGTKTGDRVHTSKKKKYVYVYIYIKATKSLPKT